MFAEPALSLFAENNLSVLANRFEWHPVTALFVYSVRLSLPEPPACLYLGLRVTHLQPPQQTYCWGQFRHWKSWRQLKSRKAGKVSILPTFLDISLESPTGVSIAVPTCSLWLTVICDCQWKVLQPLALKQWKQQFQAAVCPWLTAPCGSAAGGQKGTLNPPVIMVSLTLSHVRTRKGLRLRNASLSHPFIWGAA